MHSQSPNIILINCDDVGYGDLGCYGSTVNDTPHLDRMAREGMRFTDFYASAPVCTPSRAGMMTGCYPPRIGMTLFDKSKMRWVLFPGERKGLHPAEKTLATLMKEVGYHTRLVGKWHLGDQPPFLPTRHGFDEYFGLLYSNDMTPPKTEPLLPLIEGEQVIETEPDQAEFTRRYTEAAVDFIHRHHTERDSPFFLYFAHMYPHAPLRPDPRFVEHSRNGDYGAEIACIDWSLGELMRTLAELGLDERTLILFTSDHGAATTNGGSNAPLRGRKGQTWEGGMRVPLLARWPGTIPAGTTCREMATNMDLLPTLGHFAGYATPTDRVIDGKDISALLLCEPDARTPHKAFFYYFRDELYAVRSGPWKLHLQSGELYDLKADVGETSNVSSDHPDVIVRLEALANTCRKDLGDALLGVRGEGCRPCGEVSHAATLTPDPSA